MAGSVHEWRCRIDDATEFLRHFNDAVRDQPAFPIALQSSENERWSGRIGALTGGGLKNRAS